MKKEYYQVISTYPEFTAFTKVKGDLSEVERGFGDLIKKFKSTNELLPLDNSREQEAMSRFVANMTIALVVVENSK